MEIYKYFFFKTYTFAKKNEYNTSPEYSALLFVSQTIFVNLLTITNLIDNISTARFYFLIGGLIFIATFFLNYLFFMSKKSFLKLEYTDNSIKNIFIFIYLICTYYLFFKFL